MVTARSGSAAIGGPPTGRAGLLRELTIHDRAAREVYKCIVVTPPEEMDWLGEVLAAARRRGPSHGGAGSAAAVSRQAKLLFEFGEAWVNGEPLPCVICGRVFARADIASHLLTHR